MGSCGRQLRIGLRRSEDVIARRQARLCQLLVGLDSAIIAPMDVRTMLQELCDSAFTKADIAASWASLVNPRTGRLDLVAAPPR